MRDPKTAKDWWLGKNPTEALQADWLKIVYAIAASAGCRTDFLGGMAGPPGPNANWY